MRKLKDYSKEEIRELTDWEVIELIMIEEYKINKEFDKICEELKELVKINIIKTCDRVSEEYKI